MQLLLAKLQESKAARIARRFVHWVAVFAGTHGATPLEAALSAIGGPSLPANIVENVLAPMANRIAGVEMRREAAVGLAQLLTSQTSTLFFALDAPAVSTPRSATWGKLLIAIVELCEPPTSTAQTTGTAEGRRMDAAAAPSSAVQLGAAPALGDDEDDLLALAGGGVGGGEGTSTEYAAAFAKLVYASGVGRDRYAFSTAVDAKAYLAQCLARYSSVHPGRVAPLITATPVASTVAAYCTAAGVRLS